jgi:hypothetical protein
MKSSDGAHDASRPVPEAPGAPGDDGAPARPASESLRDIQDLIDKLAAVTRQLHAPHHGPSRVPDRTP